MHTLRRIISLFALSLAVAAARGVQSPDIRTVDDLLDALEAAETTLNRVRSDVVLIKDPELFGDREVRTGWLAYQRAQGASDQSIKQFKIRFDQMLTGQVIDESPREYIFDGEWLVEKFVNDKQFIKRQMVPPGENWDPLRLGEGPFPVPIGQRRADILREFVAELSEDKAAGLDHPRLIEQAATSHQLVLRPRPELADSADYEIVRIWYDTQTLLPRMIRAIDFAGDTSTVVMRDMRINADADVDAALFDTTPPPVGAGWDVNVEPWRGEPAANAANSPQSVEGQSRIEHQIRVEAPPEDDR